MKNPFASHKPSAAATPDAAALTKENQRLREENAGLRRALAQSEQVLALTRETARKAADDKTGRNGDKIFAAALREAAARLSAESREQGDFAGIYRYALDSRMEAVAFTDRLQGEVIGRLTETSRQIGELRQSLSDILAGWQQSIYIRDLKPLAFCLQNLERIASAHSGEEAGRKLTDTLPGFEEALKRLGVSSFAPAAGESFDPTRHVSSDDTPGSFVKEVVVRGYVKINDTSGSQDVLAPAEVILCTNLPSSSIAQTDSVS